MKHKALCPNRLATLVILPFLLSSCAWDYRPPNLEPKTISTGINVSRDQLFKVVTHTVIREGFTIILADKVAGLVSTAPNRLHLTDQQCDCGSTWGLEYIKDKRTVTNVAYSVSFDETSIAVKTTIHGQYLPNDPSYGVAMTCESTGVLEARLLHKITENLSYELRGIDPPLPAFD